MTRITPSTKTFGPEPERGAFEQVESRRGLLDNLFSPFTYLPPKIQEAKWGSSKERILQLCDPSLREEANTELQNFNESELNQFETLLKHKPTTQIFLTLVNRPQDVRTAFALVNALPVQMEEKDKIEVTDFLLQRNQEPLNKFITKGERKELLHTTLGKHPGAILLHLFARTEEESDLYFDYVEKISQIPTMDTAMIDKALSSICDVNHILKGQMTKEQRISVLDYLLRDENPDEIVDAKTRLTMSSKWVDAIKAHRSEEQSLGIDPITGEIKAKAFELYLHNLKNILPETEKGKLAQKVVIEVSDRTFLVNSQIVEDALYHALHPEITPDTEKRKLPYKRQYTVSEFGLEREFRVREGGIDIILSEPSSGESRNVRLDFPDEDLEILYATALSSKDPRATKKTLDFKRQYFESILKGIYSLEERTGNIPRSLKEAKKGIREGVLFQTPLGLSLVEGYSERSPALFCPKPIPEKDLALGIIIKGEVKMIPTDLSFESKPYSGGALLSVTSTLDIQGKKITYTSHFPDIEKPSPEQLERHLLLTMAHVNERVG